jgi:hypothetical protein
MVEALVHGLVPAALSAWAPHQGKEVMDCTAVRQSSTLVRQKRRSHASVAALAMRLRKQTVTPKGVTLPLSPISSAC